MDVNELSGLASWVKEYVEPAIPAYEKLVSAMEQNAGGSGKVLLREHLTAVEDTLLAMPVEQLSYQQTDLLASLDIEKLLGKKGWRFVEQTVKEGNYDPAAAAADIRQAKHRIDSGIALLKEVKQSLEQIKIHDLPRHYTSDKVTIRLRFKDGVEIENITQLKKWTAEWYAISQGLAMAAGERPEDVEVKGATTGSLILILGATLTVATIVALIMKQVASTVKSSMEVAHTLQDWKMRKVADAEVERVLTARRLGIEAGGVDAALALVKEKIGASVAGDVENALKKSIEKMFSFAAKGGELDMLPPPQPDDSDVDEAVADAIATIIENVQEMRQLKAATQFLIEDKGNDPAG
jgi:hypothetical protein